MKKFVWVTKIVGWIICGISGFLASRGEWVYATAFFLIGIGFTALAGCVNFLLDIVEDFFGGKREQKG